MHRKLAEPYRTLRRNEQLGRWHHELEKFRVREEVRKARYF